MHKTVITFLESKGFKPHKEKMIYEFNKNSGIVVSSFDSFEDEEEKYEFVLNFLSEKSGDPQLLFCGLTEKNLIEKFNLMYQLAYNLFQFLINHKF